MLPVGSKPMIEKDKGKHQQSHYDPRNQSGQSRTIQSHGFYAHFSKNENVVQYNVDDVSNDGNVHGLFCEAESFSKLSECLVNHEWN